MKKYRLLWDKTEEMNWLNDLAKQGGISPVSDWDSIPLSAVSLGNTFMKRT